MSKTARAGLCLLAAIAWLASPLVAVHAQEPASAGDAFANLAATTDPFAVATWASASGDAGGRPFLVVDKRAARVLAFDAAGMLVAQAPALLGMGAGDISPPGIGAMRLADIIPSLRVTPAGRYEAHLGTNLAGHRILWVDYEAALSLHPVVTGTAKERRLERLASPSILDNRISYGCINVPARFYEDVVQALFAPADGVVYILPETARPDADPARAD